MYAHGVWEGPLGKRHIIRVQSECATQQVAWCRWAGRMQTQMERQDSLLRIWRPSHLPHTCSSPSRKWCILHPVHRLPASIIPCISSFFLLQLSCIPPFPCRCCDTLCVPAVIVTMSLLQGNHLGPTAKTEVPSNVGVGFPPMALQCAGTFELMMLMMEYTRWCVALQCLVR